MGRGNGSEWKTGDRTGVFGALCFENVEQVSETTHDTGLMIKFAVERGMPRAEISRRITAPQQDHLVQVVHFGRSYRLSGKRSEQGEPPEQYISLYHEPLLVVPFLPLLVDRRPGGRFRSFGGTYG